MTACINYDSNDVVKWEILSLQMHSTANLHDSTASAKQAQTLPMC